MNDDVRLAAAQLARMRGMTGLYHVRFFADVRYTATAGLALGAAGYAIDPALFLAIPFVALLGAAQTAFDASYLVFARQYVARLEGWLNARTGGVLVAAELEAAYLFPLDVPKIVTVPIRGPMSWFSFMTLFYTVLGGLAGAAGLWLGWEALVPGAPRVVYLTSLAVLGAAALVTGLWWFGSGAGERRLREVLDRTFE